MDVLDAIRKRRSIRKYLPVAVEWDKIVDILEAGQYAPSAGNLQDWKFIVVTDADKKRKIASACLNQVWMETAPVHIVICSQPEKQEQYYGEKGHDYSLQDAACAAMNMMLAATEAGLSTCWVGAFEESMMVEALEIQETAKPCIVLAVGYSDEVVPTPPRTPLESLVYLQSYGNRVKNMNMVMWDWSLMMENFVKGVGKKIETHVAALRRKSDSMRRVPAQEKEAPKTHAAPSRHTPSGAAAKRFGAAKKKYQP